MTNTFDAANRLVSSSREGATVQPVYNAVGDRVRQTVGTTTTYYTLDVEGLPEVITSDGEIYLHLPGVIVTEKAGQVRYLLGDGLGSIRQAVDENGTVVAYNEWDPYGNPVQEGSQPYGFTGEWWQEELELLHLRARWLMPYLNQFISPDPIIPDYFKPQSLNQYAYSLNNPINYTDPSGLFAWSYLSRAPTKFKHSVIEEWFEGGNVGNYSNTLLEFAAYNYIVGVPDIIHFPVLAPPGICSNSPWDFSGSVGRVGEIYEIEPIRFLPRAGVEIAEGATQLFRYQVSLNMVAYFGGLRGQIPADGRPNRNPNLLTGQAWDFNTIRWRLGATMPPGPHTLPLRGQGPLWVIRPVPGLILYADDTTRLQAQTVLGTVMTLATLPKI